MTEPPTDVIDEAERLTRRARSAVDDNEAAAYRDRREQLLAEYDYTTRVREDDRPVLVAHPAEWTDEEGNVHPDRVDDVDRGIERPLEGPADPDNWEAVAEYNDDIVAAVDEAHGDPHAATARALADFLANHYAKRIDEATAAELREFESEYFPRNSWPSDAQRETLSQSLDLIFERTDSERPE
ncbi:rnhA operon protein [Halapricum sp. CBA1109]|uniref:DUF7108 family protein n=1 Tax=Halapricum sp. CBA1109 TaxID=2668068 RepID=UPI0012FC80AA|nr:rnhA operon protein [Halapricum sp. CBA1109]MUV90932.1 rnhA operon protein [Halapricum sp. CBA1109]